MYVYMCIYICIHMYTYIYIYIYRYTNIYEGREVYSPIFVDGADKRPTAVFVGCRVREELGDGTVVV